MLKKKQIRLPGYSLFTRVHLKIYNLVDGYVYGDSFFDSSSFIFNTDADREYYFNDAADQILDFNKSLG